MGDVADMMLDGTLCEGCGVALNDDAPLGYPRRCADCERQSELDDITRASMTQAASTKVACPLCGKRVKFAGMKDHQRSKHSS